MKWLALQFPCRTRTDELIEVLKQQLAQAQRRNDELAAILAEVSKPAPKVQFERKSDGKLVPIQRNPLGWDDFRASRRARTSRVQSEEKKESE